MPRVADPLERRRKELLAAATELFARRSFHGSSMGDLADAVGINKGTLYHYFESKTDILYDIFRSVSDDMLSQLQRIPPTDPPSEQLRQVVRMQLEVIAERPQAVRVYYRESPMLTEWMPTEQLADIRARETIYNNFVMQILQRGIEGGTFRPVNVKVAAFGVIGVGAWASTWYDPAGPVKIDELGALYAEVILRGLETDRASDPAINGATPRSRKSKMAR